MKEIELSDIEANIIVGFIAKMRIDNMTFHEAMDWWRKIGQVAVFQINNQLLEEENKNEV